VQYSAAVDNFSHQQQYLLSQQEQAKKADEDALIQADSGRIIITLPPFGAEDCSQCKFRHKVSIAEYTPGWRKAGLPTKGSHLVLDSLQVQQAGTFATAGVAPVCFGKSESYCL